MRKAIRYIGMGFGLSLIAIGLAMVFFGLMIRIEQTDCVRTGRLFWPGPLAFHC